MNKAVQALPQSVTVLSWASAHGRSQLKCQKVRVGGYTEKLLKWFNYPRARAHPNAKLAVRVYRIVASSALHWGQPDSGESCVVLQSWPTRSLVAKFPHRSVIASSMQISCCRERTLWTRPWISVCEFLMPNVVVPEVHQNNHSYVSSVDLPLDSLRKNLAWWAVTQRALKNHKTQNLGGGRLLGTIRYISHHSKANFSQICMFASTHFDYRKLSAVFLAKHMHADMVKIFITW